MRRIIAPLVIAFTFIGALLIPASPAIAGSFPVCPNWSSQSYGQGMVCTDTTLPPTTTYQHVRVKADDILTDGHCVKVQYNWYSGSPQWYDTGAYSCGAVDTADLDWRADGVWPYSWRLIKSDGSGAWVFLTTPGSPPGGP